MNVVNSLANNAPASDHQDGYTKSADALVTAPAATANAAMESHSARIEHRIHPCATPPGRVDHTYRDFSHFPHDGDYKGKRATSNFPAKLHMILSNPAYSHVITWMPHGRAWKILNKELFMKEVTPNYFGQNKYESFTRQLSGWGFKHLHQSGPDFRAYYHECFLRGLPHLTRLMKRPSHSGKLMPHVEGEPNFYHMSEQYPLPLDDSSLVASAAPSSYTLHSKSAPVPSHPPPPTTQNGYYYGTNPSPVSVHVPNHSTCQNYLPSYPSYSDGSYNAYAQQPPPQDYHYPPQYSTAHKYDPPNNDGSYNAYSQQPPPQDYHYPPQYSTAHKYAPPNNNEAYPPAPYEYPSLGY
jgi:hypothetical protein